MTTPNTDIGRNDSCHCGSGKKYKKCHLDKDEGKDRKEREKMALNAAKDLAEKVKEAEKSGAQPAAAHGQKRGHESQKPSLIGRMANKMGFFRNKSG